MRKNERITLRRAGETRYDPISGRHIEASTADEVLVCNISVIKDYVNEVQQGRLSGNTIKARFSHPVGRFDYALYNNKTYRPTEYVRARGRMSVTLEEVAYVW